VTPDPVRELADAVEEVLADGVPEAEGVERLRPAMQRFLGVADGALTADQRASWNGEAAGHLLHADPDGRFHIMTVVFPPGTSSGIHEHGCWGVIGYLQGLDEEARYRRVDGGEGPEGCVLEKVDEVVHAVGDVSRLLPPDEMFHRVRNPGEVDGVSVHILCHTPEDHPHRFWDRDGRRLLPFPFRTLPGGVVRAEVMFDA
jgi:predicted metal-dependent enzyme (double-stranded beta helix superfamily)